MLIHESWGSTVLGHGFMKLKNEISTMYLLLHKRFYAVKFFYDG